MDIAKAVVVAVDCGGSASWPALGLATPLLVPVANRPVLFHHLDALRDAGVRAVAIVTDETTRACLPEALEGGAVCGLDVMFVRRPEEATEFVGDAAVVLHVGDALMCEPLDALRDEMRDRSLDAFVLAGVGAPGKPCATPLHHPPNGYLLGPGVHRALAGFTVALAGAAPKDAVALLAECGAGATVREVATCFPCRAGTDGLLEANRCMLERLMADSHPDSVINSEIQGRVAVHPSAEIRSSVIRGPVTIGPRTTITEAYVGPYTAVGADARIEGVEIEHSIVFADAHLRFVGARIESSIIGPAARVVRDFRVRQGMRMSVGERAAVALS